MQIEIRALNESLRPSQRTLVERRLSYALSRFGNKVRRVLVRLEDMNGPRGGLDKRCQIEVRLQGRGTLVAEVSDTEIEPAVSRAADRIARRMRDALTTRRDSRKDRTSLKAMRMAG